MKNIKYILIVLILSLIFSIIPFIIYQVYLNFNYTIDGYKWIEFRNLLPEGVWVQAKFVVIGMYGEEGVVFNIPSEKLEEFEKQLKQEIKDSPIMKNPQWHIYQFRVITTKGRYTTEAFIAEDRILADTWMSQNLKNILCEWDNK